MDIELVHIGPMNDKASDALSKLKAACENGDIREVSAALSHLFESCDCPECTARRAKKPETDKKPTPDKAVIDKHQTALKAANNVVDRKNALDKAYDALGDAFNAWIDAAKQLLE